VISLLRVELRRATSRRLVRFGVAATLVAIVVAGTIVAVNSHKPTSAELARANEVFQANMQQCLSGHYIREKDLPPNTTFPEFCSKNVRPEFFVPNHEFELFGLPGILAGVSPLLVLGALLIGASLVGAEWHAGTMTTLLTWEPRRIRVLIAKALAAALVVVVLAIALQVVLSLVLGLVAATRGSTAQTGGDWQRRVAGTILRVGGASTVASLIGLSIAMLGRNTAAALGVGFAYLGVLEGLIRGLRPAWQPWLLGDNVAVFVSGHVTQLGLPPGDVTRTVGAAAAVAFGYAAVLLLVAGTGFRLRDVQ
jgi:ABC-type transport system involved in multi-copper enzyme maturation permease subunit